MSHFLSEEDDLAKEKERIEHEQDEDRAILDEEDDAFEDGGEDDDADDDLEDTDDDTDEEGLED